MVWRGAILKTNSELVREFLSRCFDKNYITDYDDSSTFSDLDFDSLDKIEMAMDFEREFDIIIESDLVSELNTVSDFINCIIIKIDDKE